MPGVNFPGYNDHATHVATTIAADKRSDGKYIGDIVGVAPKATILGYNFLGTYTGTNPVNAEDLFISHVSCFLWHDKTRRSLWPQATLLATKKHKNTQKGYRPGEKFI